MPLIAARRVLFGAFMLSGFTGLIYESLWTHYLKLYLGHAAFAQSLVLAIFMGGMALGGVLASAACARLRNLLAAYAVAEACIGVFALGFHALFSALEQWSFASVIPSLGSPAAVDLVQWSVALVLLLPPSVLLGATFPLMSSAVIRRFPGRDGGNLATLYFTNSLGAAVGALVASFLLIGALGLPGTLTLAGVLNLAIAALAGALSRSTEPAQQTPADPPRSDRLPLLFLAAAFATGAASFVYEMSWIRMLSLVLGSSFHAFELMLSAFITGLALGSLAIRSRIDRIADPVAAGAWIQIAMGLLAMLTLPVYAASFDWMAALVTTLPKDPDGWLWFNLASHGIAFAVMLPATVMAGMTLPLFTHILLRAGHGEKSIGRIYAANSLGAIAGVLFTMHLALPALGLKLTLASGAMLDIALGLAMLRVVGAGRRGWLAAFGAIVVPLALVRLVVLDASTLGGGVFRTGTARPKGMSTVFYRDGKTATISVALYGDSALAISTNGKPDATIEMNPGRPAAPDEITMVMLGAVPLALRPDARRIANIGFGSGLTTHTLLASPTVEEVSTIEIEPAIVEGSRAFMERVFRAYRDPRSQVAIEDAKSWFARHNRRFDIIISEPSNPWVSGVSSLFSDEFYRRVKDYLDDRGLLVQWLHLYEFDIRLAASIVKALEKHFGSYSVYNTDGSNILVVAARNGTVPPLGDAILRMPGLPQELERVGIRTLDDLRFRWLGSSTDLGPMLRAVDAPPNSDSHPYVELNAPRSRFLKSNAVEISAIALSALPVVEMLSGGRGSWRAEHVTPGSNPRHTGLRDAIALRRALLGVAPADPAAAARVGAWRTRLGGCAALDRDDALAALHEVAVATLAALDPAALDALWAAPAWLPCAAADWPARLRGRMDLYQAIARRDAAGMHKAAAAALDQTAAPAAAAGEASWRRYAFGAGALAARVRGDDAGLLALWTQHGPALYPSGRYPTELAILLAPR